MKIITYFIFTLLSVFIQFCVMDFIQGKTQIGLQQAGLTKTSQKMQLSDIIKNTSYVKSHGLYYNMKANILWNNSSLPINDLQGTNYSIGLTTDNPSSIFGFYDENSSITDITSATDLAFTSTEVDNITEITLFNSDDQTTQSPVTKIPINKECRCNFLYNICDINCCCDKDCTDKERELFSCPNSIKVNRKFEINCNHFMSQRELEYKNDVFRSVLSIAKTNLPDKRIRRREQETLGYFYRWNVSDELNFREIIKFNINRTKEFIWILNKGYYHYFDIPTQFINNYCMNRHPIKFLQKVKSSCMVKLNDLEMFHILDVFDEGNVVSSLEDTVNSTVLNCSTLYCAPNNILACDDHFCVVYNKSLHKPMCTENICTNIALRIEFLFYYFDMVNRNVTIKFHMENISMDMVYFVQEISVDFFLANISNDVLEFSGSPGYVMGRPIIVSYNEGNHTDQFYNNSIQDKYVRLPFNRNGLCTLTNNIYDYLLFGINKKTKCKYIYTKKFSENLNYSSICTDIQKSIKNMLGIRDLMYVSPYGNPYDIKDEDWIPVQKVVEFPEPFGENDTKQSKIKCNGIIKSVLFTIAYAVKANENKILTTEYEVAITNKCYDIEDISNIITINVIFLDQTTPEVEEYDGSTHIAFGLPKDFFYPFSSSNSNLCCNCLSQIFFYCILILVFE